MGNEIDIIVKGIDQSAPVMKGAEAGWKKTSAEISRSSEEAAKKSGRAWRESQREIEKSLRATADTTRAEHAKADAAINATRREIAELTVAMARGGDEAQHLGKKIAEAQNRLKGQMAGRSLLGDPKDAEREADRIAEQLGKGLLRSGGRAAAGLAEGIGNKIKDHPAIAAGILASAVTVAPLLGATISAGIVGATGLGAVAAGFALLKDDARIKAAGEGLKENLLGDLRDSASVMINPVLTAIEKTSGRLDGLGGNFDRIFGRAATFVEPLTDGLLDAADSITGGLADALDGALPVIEAASDGVAALGDAIGDTFSDMSDNGASNAEALTIVLGILEGAIRAVGETTNFLADQYRNLSYGVHLLMGDTEGANALFEQTPPLVEQTSNAYQDASEAAEDLAKEQKELNDAMYDASAANRDAITAALDYKDALKEAKDAVDGLNTVSDDEMRKLVAVADEADNLTASLEGSGASTEELSNAVKRGKDDVYNLGVSMGLSKQKARELADQLIAVPRSVSANVNVNTGVARTRLQEVQYLLGSIRSKTITVDVIESIYRQDDALARRANGRAHGGISGAEPGFAATGGARGGMTWVGERGPELVKLPFGSTVYPAGQSQAMAMNGAAGGGPSRIELVITGGDAAGQALVSTLQFEVRTKGGGDVVSYLGGK